jgi:hypothetical protein
VEYDLVGALEPGRQLGALDEALGVRVHAPVDLVQLLLAERPVPALHPGRHAHLLLHGPLDHLRAVQPVVRLDALLGEGGQHVGLLPEVEARPEVVHLLEVRADAVFVPRALPRVHAVRGRAFDVAPVVVQVVLDLVKLFVDRAPIIIKFQDAMLLQMIYEHILLQIIKSMGSERCDAALTSLRSKVPFLHLTAALLVAKSKVMKFWTKKSSDG